MMRMMIVGSKMTRMQQVKSYYLKNVRDYILKNILFIVEDASLMKKITKRFIVMNSLIQWCRVVEKIISQRYIVNVFILHIY